MLSFVIVEEDQRIKTSYPFNEVTAVLLLNNPRYHHTSHSDEPLSYQDKVLAVANSDHTPSNDQPSMEEPYYNGMCLQDISPHYMIKCWLLCIVHTVMATCSVETTHYRQHQ